jgi:Skp family chaperone for outer membrane proteins
VILRPRSNTRLALLLAAASLTLPFAVPAQAQQSPGWFVPPATAPTQSAPPATRGRPLRAPQAGQAEEAPPPPVASSAGGDPSDEIEQAEAERKAANLPAPPAPPLQPLVSAIYAAATTGDAVKITATGIGAALPAPLEKDTTYYVIKTTDNDVKLAASAADATAGTAITLTTEGAGVLRMTLPTARNGQTNLAADFSVKLPGDLKILPGGFAPPTAAVGVLGVPDVMRASSAAQAVDKVISARKEQLQAEVQRAQAYWRSLDEKLREEAPKLNRDQLVARENELRSRMGADRHRLQEQSRIIQEAAQVSLGQIERTLIGIIRQVAESRNMNLVLHRSQVALNIQEFDITDAVVAQLNRVLPTVQIPPADKDPATLPRDWGTPAATAAAR